MEKAIRVLVANRPRLLPELILSTFADQTDIEIVGELSDESEIFASVDKTSPNFVVIGLDQSGRRPAICDELLREHPEIRVIAVAPERNYIVYYWASVDIHSSNVEASEEGILSTLRSATLAEPTNEWAKSWSVIGEMMLDKTRWERGAVGFAFVLLLCAPSWAQQPGVRERKIQDENFATPRADEPSDLARENLNRVAASAAQLREVLVKDEGLLVELKRWIAKETTDNGQVVDDANLTDSAIFERLELDVEFRSVATRLVQRYGYLMPSPNPDSDLAKEKEFVLKERARRLVPIESQEDSSLQRSRPGGQEFERTGTCDARREEDCARTMSTDSQQKARPQNETRTPSESPEGSQQPSPRLPSRLIQADEFPQGSPEREGTNSRPDFELASESIKQDKSPLTGSSSLSPDTVDGSAPHGILNPGTNDAIKADNAMAAKNRMTRSARQISPWGQEEEDPTSVKMVHRANPYSDIPSLYDMYVQASVHQKPVERFGLDTFRNGANELITCSLILAWFLRFDFTLPYRPTLLLASPVLLVTRLAAIPFFGLPPGWWKYVGIADGIDILKAVGMGSVLFWFIMRFALGAAAFPRTIYVMEALLTAGLLSGMRLLSRVVAESMRENISSGKRVILIGAGSAAQTILREIRKPGSSYVAVGCLDDDKSKQGIRIGNVRVLGTVKQLSEVLSSEPADEVLIAVPSATGAQMRAFVEACNHANIRFRTVPALKDIIAGHVAVSQLREVSLEDLLGREPVQIDLESVRRQIAGRCVVVTGAAGSIGSELCRQILNYSPAQLICLDQSETGLYFLRLDLMNHSNGTQLAFRVGDICDVQRVRALLTEFRPEVMFHAAAYKHVPLMESNVQEAVQNNVVGFISLLDLADESGCKSFVLISSDKAVNPTNVMGATKRICELIISSRPANGMRCVSVRFGNVLGSSGSVIPVLKQQLSNRQPLTITHPEIKRFFMLTPEAVALVLQAFAVGCHGDILVLDMGESVRIIDLARNLIRLSGRSEQDVEIHFTGLREGEKLDEELFYDHERVTPTVCEKIKRTNGAHRNWHELCRQLDELRASLTVDGAKPIRAKIKEIVPEYSFADDPIWNQRGARAESVFQRAAGDD